MEHLQERFNFPINMGGVQYDNAYSFFINSMLVIYGYRPSFLIQQVDFDNDDDYRRILTECMEIIPTFLTTPEEFQTNEEYQTYINNNTLVAVEHPYGLLVTTSRLLDDNFFRLLLLNSVHDDEIFGNILGYPCAGDIENDGIRIIVNITMINHNNQEIFSNICIERNLPRIIQKFRDINDFVRTLNPDLELQIRRINMH